MNVVREILSELNINCANYQLRTLGDCERLWSLFRFQRQIIKLYFIVVFIAPFRRTTHWSVRCEITSSWWWWWLIVRPIYFWLQFENIEHFYTYEIWSFRWRWWWVVRLLLPSNQHKREETPNAILHIASFRCWHII